MFPGSNTKEGYLYHDNPFERVSAVQRRDSDLRLERILLHLDPSNKRILDIGCNIGYFTFKLVGMGAVVDGIDHDTQAIAMAKQLQENHAVTQVNFYESISPEMLPHIGNRYAVLLALSVIPWLYKTMAPDDAEALVNNLFEIPVAFVELMYEGDGRAPMKGIKNDADAKKYLERWYPFVWPIFKGEEYNDGVRRTRTLWKCCKKMDVDRTHAPIVGAQSFVYLGEDFVIKEGRSNSRYDAVREYNALLEVAGDYIAPYPIICEPDSNTVILARLRGRPLATLSRRVPNLDRELAHIQRTLQERGVKHHDIRPENILINDETAMLIDFGWAEWGKDRAIVPPTINPKYSHDDAASIHQIIKEHAL